MLGDAHALPDLRVLAGIAEELGAGLGFRTVEQARAEMRELGPWDGERGRATRRPPPRRRRPTAGCVLSTWQQLIDDGRMHDGDDYLKATARTAGRAGLRRHARRRSASSRAPT